jgi:hypothetical protein
MEIIMADEEIKTDEKKKVPATSEDESKKILPEEGEKGTEQIVNVSIGEDSPPPEEESSVIRKLRTKHKEQRTRIRELEAQTQNSGNVSQLGDKPTLEGCAFDAEKFAKELETWHTKKAEVDRQKAKAQADKEAQDNAWNAKLANYGEKKAALALEDFEDAEEATKDTLSTVQQGLIIKAADDPALLVYALGKNPKRATELAAIKDPVQFIAAMSKMEATLKVTRRTRAAAPPEEVTRGSGIPASSTDATLDELRAQAAKTGDFTKVHAYKRKMRAKE